MVWVVLCEDEQQYAFANHFLKQMATPELRQCYKVLGPGHQGVRAKLTKEVASIRKQGSAAALLAIIDADGHSIEARRRYAQELLDDGQQLAVADPIAILVAERNIETWIHWLENNDVDTATRYPKRKGRERECRPAVNKLKAACDKNNLPHDAPASILDACKEFDRVLSILRG